MRTLIIKNKNNKTLEISEYNNSYVLEKLDGLGSSNTNLYTSKSPNQDGESYQGNTLQSRVIHIELSILANNKEDMIRKRSNLINVLNAKLGEVEILYKNGTKANKISGVLDNLSFPYENNFDNFTQTVLIDIYCPDPFLKEVGEVKAEIALWKGLFEFPLEILEEGIEMGYREPSLIVNVFNKGDVDCGIRLEFKALATVENPSLFNVNTREFFKINKTMTAGEVITITTYFQNKRVTLNNNGVITNAFNWIDLDSTFLQLEPGDNLFRYDADSGLDNLEVSVYHIPQYLGV